MGTEHNNLPEGITAGETTLTGDIVSIVYANEENGYAVVEVETPEGARVTAVGTIPFPGEGETLYAEGEYVFHPSFGAQFRCDSIERELPTDAASVIRYLSSGAVKGIGPATARKLVSRFGSSIFSIIRENPERLTEITGITSGRAKSISAEFTSRFAVRDLMSFLSGYGFELSLAVAVYKRFGASGRDMIMQDPYVLAVEPFNGVFGKVDGLGADMGVAAEDYRRVSAGILCELFFNQNEGHVCLPTQRLVPATEQFLGVSAEDVTAALDRLCAERRTVREAVGGEEMIYLSRMYDSECFVAKRLRDLAGAAFRCPAGADKAITELERSAGIEFSALQRSAVLTSVSSPCMVLTGGPGTGKTTAVRGMVELMERMGSRVALAAPTGRAAKRLSELTGRDARTIHRLLEVAYRSDGMGFVRCMANPLEVDVVIVDEASMVDLPLMASLMSAMRLTTRLILVGDPDQLPSVGPGTVLGDILKSAVVPCIQLTEVFRQARESDIIMNAHAVNKGEVPRLSGNKKDFFFLNRSTDEVAETVASLCAKRLPEKMGIAPGDIQVISPSRQLQNSVNELNPMLRDILNPASPDKKEYKSGAILFREGDRVMQIRNNYDILWEGSEDGVGVFNGDMGVIKSINSGTEKVRVEFPDKTCVYDFASMNELEHAYAVTVHKAQGSEFRAVIFVASLRNSRLLNRNLFYTAMTRAKELFIIVGSPETVSVMVNNKRKLKRFSGLLTRLTPGQSADESR